MRVWVIATGEPVPFLPAEIGDRHMRAGWLAKQLAQDGHEVTWWTTHFDHYRKRHRDVSPDIRIPSGTDGLDLVFLRSRGYDTNFCVRRFLDHRDVKSAFRREAIQAEPPDLIFCAFPLVELADAAVAYGKKYGVPVALDVRDLWPDVVYEQLKSRTGIPVHGIFFPYEIEARRALRRADAVVSISSGMLDWTYTRFGRARGGDYDMVLRQSKSRPKITDQEIFDLAAFWAAKGVDLSNGKLRLVWAGNIVHNTDGESLLKAVSLLDGNTADAVEIVICGLGSLVPMVEALAARHSCLKYAGWVPEAELNYLLERSHVGLLCYLDRPDFQMSTPNKVIDYCGAGLRILTNLTGEISTLTNDTDFLIHYPTGDARALAARISSLANARAHYVTKSAASRIIFENIFDPASVLPKFKTMLAELAMSKTSD